MSTTFWPLVPEASSGRRGLFNQTSVTSGTIFEQTTLPLTTWFLGMYFLTQPKNGIPALEI